MNPLGAIAVPYQRRRDAKHIPPLLPARRAESRYTAQLLEWVEILRTLTETQAIPALPLLTGFAPDVINAQRLDIDPADFEEIVAGMRVVWGMQVTRDAVRRVASVVADEVIEHHGKQFDRQVASVLGVAPLRQESWQRILVQSFAAQNAALITSTGQRYFGELERVVIDGVVSGRRHEEIARELQRRFLQRTAPRDPGDPIDTQRKPVGLDAQFRRIARDQVSKLMGQLSRIRQTALGVTRYTWRTAMDERVRSSHAALEGRVFRWNSPPPIGHPGEPIQCRCYAEPILSDIV